MAKLILKGDTADVEICQSEDGDAWIATCELHASRSGCVWSETYGDLRDATEYAADHADFGSD